MVPALVQQTVASKAEVRLHMATARWDAAIDSLFVDVSLGKQMDRLKFKGAAARLRLFDGLRLNNTGRESRHREALDFETSWAKAEATWIFKEGLTFEIFRKRRRALRDLEEAYYPAVKHELFARASLRTQASEINGMSMDWSDAATITFAAETVPGASGGVKHLPGGVLQSVLCISLRAPRECICHSAKWPGL